MSPGLFWKNMAGMGGTYLGMSRSIERRLLNAHHQTAVFITISTKIDFPSRIERLRHK
jgi:hypothetical protein